MNIKRFLMISAAMTACFVAVMAFVHTPQGLAFWGRLRGSKACPLGMDVAHTPEARDARRALESASLRGTGKARSSRFLGFTLNETQRSDVDAWAKTHNARCAAMRVSAADLECKVHGPTDDKGSASQADIVDGAVFFSFDSRGRLKSVHSMLNYADAGAAAQAFSTLRDETDANLGAVPTQNGEPSPAYLSAGLLRQVAAEYRLQDVYARLSATHMPAAYIVEQKFRAVAD